MLIGSRKKRSSRSMSPVRDVLPLIPYGFFARTVPATPQVLPLWVLSSLEVEVRPMMSSAIAVFAEATWSLSDKSDLTVGARYTNDRDFTRISAQWSARSVLAMACQQSSWHPGFLATSDRCRQTVSYSATLASCELSSIRRGNAHEIQFGLLDGGFNRIRACAHVT